MRDDSSHAPAPQQRHIYRTVIEADEPGYVEYKSTGTAIFEFLRGLCSTGLVSGLPPLSAQVLLILLDRINGHELRTTGRLLAWPGRSYLCAMTMRCPGQVKRAIKALQDSGVVQILQEGRGNEATVYQMLVPEDAGGRARQRAQGRARRGRVRQRAPKKEIKKEIKNSSSKHGEGAPALPPTGSGLVAAAAELEKAGIAGDVARELAELPTTTPVVILAATIDVSGKHVKNPPGLIRCLVETPGLITDQAMNKARARLSPKPPAQPARRVEPAKPTESQVEELASFGSRMKQLLREQKGSSDVVCERS